MEGSVLLPLEQIKIDIQAVNEDLLLAFGFRDDSENTYRLDQEGCIEIPVIGKIDLMEKTISEAETIVADQMKKYVNDIYVDIEPLSIDFSIFGAVRKPSNYNLQYKPYTIFDAIAIAGNQTSKADISNIKVLRRNGHHHIYSSFDLTKPDSFKDYFYIRSGDIIYVNFRKRIFSK